jgi:hypothetical protein
VQVLAVTLNGGVAAGAVVNEMGAGLSLISVILWPTLTASADTGAKFNDFGFALIFAPTPLPFSLIRRTPYLASLFNCSCPCCFPFTVGADATAMVQEAPAGMIDGQLFEVTTNPLLTVGGSRATAAFAAVLVTITLAALL